MGCVVEHAWVACVASIVICLVLRRKLILRASSVALSSSTYTDAALVLDVSARVAEVAGSGLVDVHVCVASSTASAVCCVGSACMVDDAMQVQIDQAASCGCCYSCRCV